MVSDDLTLEANVFIWLKPLSHSAVDTAKIFVALMWPTSLSGGSSLWILYILETLFLLRHHQNETNHTYILPLHNHTLMNILFANLKGLKQRQSLLTLISHFLCLGIPPIAFQDWQLNFS